MIRPSMYMAKLDIKDVYYSIPIQSQHQKYLKMKNNNKLFKYTVLPNGYTEGPRKFTKVMKPPLATLRKEKISIADYIDDLITMSKSFNQFLLNIDRIVTLQAIF